ncbi:MAG: hypothetical protein O2931_09590, partial [Planctomycetota bacterium]|nr:hypothetical protein [Planctomycetota bacterium]
MHQLIRTALILAILPCGVSTPLMAQRDGGGSRGRRDGEGFRQRMLERLDANGNGLVEPNEIPEESRRYMDRFAQNAGVAPGESIPVAGGSTNATSQGKNQSSTGDRTPKISATSDGSKKSEDLYPRIQKFGDPSVHRFGVSAETLRGKVVDLEKRYDRRILEAVERTLERYDRNKTGLLEYDEWVLVHWQKDPRESDLDHDGQLTKAELAERYRQGQIDDVGDADRSAGGIRGRSLAGPDARGEEPVNPPRRRRGRRDFDPANMIANLDQNNNGMIDPDEVDERMKGFVERRFGLTLDRPIAIDEVNRSMSGGDIGDDQVDANKPSNKTEPKKPTEPPATVAGYRVAGEEKL